MSQRREVLIREERRAGRIATPGAQMGGRRSGICTNLTGRFAGAGALACGLAVAVVLPGCARMPASAPPAVQPPNSAVMIHASPADEGRARELADGTNRFGFALCRELARAKPGGNVLVSPYSLGAALAVTANGAAGATQQAMLRTLGLGGWSRSDMNLAHFALRQRMAAGSPGVVGVMSSSLWARRGLPLRSDFLSRTSELYGASVESLDFAAPDALERLNGWVSKETRGMIPVLVQAGDLNPDLMLLILNAVYFKGEWAQRFDPAETREGTFTLADGRRVTVPLMVRSGRFDYAEDDALQAVRLPYRGDRFEMVVLLPRAGSRLAGSPERLTPEVWERCSTRLLPRSGTLRLPRFRLGFEAELRPVLSSMGMQIAFQPGADFSAMFDRGAGPAAIGKVRHKTALDVNEAGTEASAASSVHVEKAAPSPPFTMDVDRPFLCILREKSTGLFVFLGWVGEPG